ncbi:MAG: four helix bundle protein [Deltaproteobacteria bacterium]|nr:four helix bundle protein [Deltaproteobacteria bacterium]
MKLEKLLVYKLAMEIGEKVWHLVENWNYFPRSTIGKQIVNSADSIAANISEGYGRFHYKENKQFLYYARGSLSETKTWITKAANRNLIEEELSKSIIEKIDFLSVKLNNYLKSIGKTNQ